MVVLKDREIKTMENANPDNMDPWNRIISKVIDSPSPIIAAVITTIIAGLSAYIAWRTYKNSLVGTPPELLKYDKWLDIVEKRNSLKNENLSLQNREVSWDDHFDEALKLYEGNAIWESMVINNVPRGRVRKFLLKLDIQAILYKDEEEIPSDTFAAKGFWLILCICLYLFILLQITFTVFHVIYTSGDHCFLFIYLLWLVISLYPTKININIIPEIAKLYYYKMKKISPQDPPGFQKLYPRFMYKDFIAQDNLFFSEVDPKKKWGMMYIIRNSLFIVAFFFYALSALNGILVSINIASQLKLNFNLSNLFGTRDLNIGETNFHTIMLSLISLIFYYLSIYLLQIKRGGKYLLESELKMTNGQWKSGNKRIYINNGIIKIEMEHNKTNSIEERSLSIRMMKKIFNSKKTKIFKCVKFISRNTANNCAKGSMIESSTLIIEYEGQSIEFYPEEFKSE